MGGGAWFGTEITLACTADRRNAETARTTPNIHRVSRRRVRGKHYIWAISAYCSKCQRRKVVDYHVEPPEAWKAVVLIDQTNRKGSALTN
jgi:hypothetical protein